MKIKTPFSYYGGKSKIAHLYPEPEHKLIIEPFAGSAAYSWLHRRIHHSVSLSPMDDYRRKIWLNDLDPKTFSMWKFLTSADASAIVEAYVPDRVEPGMKVDEFIPADQPGLIELCRAEANQGTQGAKGTHNQITSMGAKCWKVRRKLLEVIPEVANWEITNVDYRDLANVEATWFVDPPYSNAAGTRYRTANLDYQQLGWWCLNRKGQVIVCENYGADWLEFERFNHDRVSIRSRYQRANAQEVMWHRSSSESTSARNDAAPSVSAATNSVDTHQTTGAETSDEHST